MHVSISRVPVIVKYRQMLAKSVARYGANRLALGLQDLIY